MRPTQQQKDSVREWVPTHFNSAIVRVRQNPEHGTEWMMSFFSFFVSRPNWKQWQVWRQLRLQFSFPFFIYFCFSRLSKLDDLFLWVPLVSPISPLVSFNTRKQSSRCERGATTTSCEKHHHGELKTKHWSMSNSYTSSIPFIPFTPILTVSRSNIHFWSTRETAASWLHYLNDCQDKLSLCPTAKVSIEFLILSFFNFFFWNVFFLKEHTKFEGEICSSCQ